MNTEGVPWPDSDKVTARGSDRRLAARCRRLRQRQQRVVVGDDRGAGHHRRRRHDGGGAATTAAAGGATTAAAGGTSGGGGLAEGVCPATITIQTDWNPEAEHGFLYQMIGAGYTINADKKSVTGTADRQQRQRHRRKLQVRSGGPAIGFSDGHAQMYPDDVDPARLRLHRRGDPVLQGPVPDRRHRVAPSRRTRR